MQQQIIYGSDVDVLPPEIADQMRQCTAQVGWMEALQIGGMQTPQGQYLFNNSIRGAFSQSTNSLHVCSQASFLVAQQLNTFAYTQDDAFTDAKKAVHTVLTETRGENGHEKLDSFTLGEDQINVAAAYFAAQSLAQLSVAPENIDRFYSKEEKEKFTPIDEIKTKMMQLLMKVVTDNTAGVHAFYATHQKSRMTIESKPFLLMALSHTQPTSRDEYIKRANDRVEKLKPGFPQMPETLSQFLLFLSENQQQNVKNATLAAEAEDGLGCN